MAMRMDPSFAQNVKRFYVMGGSVLGVGNISPNAEFNFYQDPESNVILFDSVTKEAPIILTPWETVLKTTISKVRNYIYIFKTYIVAM